MKRLLSLTKSRNVRLAVVVTAFVLTAAYFVYSYYNQVMPQVSINFLNDIVSPKKDSRIMIISPHPDDEAIAAGGYIYEASKQGASVYIVLVTDGNKHGLKDRRYGEFDQVSSILGVPESNLIFLNFSDGKLSLTDRQVVRQAILSSIEEVKPDTIVYPNPRDKHADHSTAGEITKEIINSLPSKPTSYQYLVHFNRFPQPKSFSPSLYLLPPTNLVSFEKEWQRFSLSQEAEDKKTEAIFAYKSQLRVPILRSLILSSIRKNELFSLPGGNND